MEDDNLDELDVVLDENPDDIKDVEKLAEEFDEFNPDPAELENPEEDDSLDTEEDLGADEDKAEEEEVL